MSRTCAALGSLFNKQFFFLFRVDPIGDDNRDDQALE
jgi:hypothetical protein